MTIIKEKTLKGYRKQYPDAEVPLAAWVKVMKIHTFCHLDDIRRIFPTADAVGEGKNLVCFNFGGNKYRLIVRITYPKTIFVREFLTHKEYSKKYRY